MAGAKYRQSYITLDASKGEGPQGRSRVDGIGGDPWAYADDFMGELEGPHTLHNGSDAQALDPARETAMQGGVIQLVTGNADGTTAADNSQIVFSSCPIQLDDSGDPVTVEAKVRIATAITDVSVFFGLTDITTADEEPFTNSGDTITSNATDACGFLYDTDGTAQWWMCAVDSDTDDTGNAALGATAVPVADEWQHLKMEIAGDGSEIVFYIDGEPLGTLLATGVGPDVPLYATIIACSTTTTSKTVECDWIRLSGTRGS